MLSIMSAAQYNDINVVNVDQGQIPVPK